MTTENPPCKDCICLAVCISKLFECNSLWYSIRVLKRDCTIFNDFYDSINFIQNNKSQSLFNLKIKQIQEIFFHRKDLPFK